MDDTELNPKDVEDIVIGQVLFEPENISRAIRILKPECFYGEPHRIVFSAAMNLWRDGNPVDLVTMHRALKKSGQIDQVGGPYQLVQWTRPVCQSTHLEYHCAIIHEQYSLRVLRDTGLKMAGQVTMSANPEAILASLSAGVTLASGADLGTDVNAGERAYALLNTKEKPTAMKLGLSSIDDFVFVMDDNMIVVTAPSGVGKTSAVMSVIMNWLPVRKPWVVSLEMSADEIITRALCSLAHVDIDLALEGRLDPEEQARMALAANHHGDLLSRMDIDDSGYMTIDTFRAKAEHKVKNAGVGVIAVDYGQLMDADKSLWKNTTERLEVISRGIKATSRVLKVPIFVIVQLNKDGEIYGTGQFEKDAHVVIKLSRPEGYDGFLDYSIPKNRNGKPGVAGRTPAVLRWGIVGKSLEDIAPFSIQLPALKDFTEPARQEPELIKITDKPGTATAY